MIGEYDNLAAAICRDAYSNYYSVQGEMVESPEMRDNGVMYCGRCKNIAVAILGTALVCMADAIRLNYVEGHTIYTDAYEVRDPNWDSF